VKRKIVFSLAAVLPIALSIGLWGCLERIQETVTQEEVAAAKSDQLFEASVAKFGVEPSVSEALPNCEVWCNPTNPDYRCFFAGSLGQKLDKQIQALTSRLTAAQPIRLPHSELLRIFELENVGYENARGDTSVANNELSNEGESSILSTQTTAKLSLRVTVPEHIKYTFVKTTGGFTISNGSANSGFALDIGDPILQRTYGGLLQVIDVTSTRALLTSERGCISYDFTPHMASGEVYRLFGSTVARRVAAERAAGASVERISNVVAAYAGATVLSAEACTVEDCRDDCDPETTVVCKTDLGQACMSAEKCLEARGTQCK
jgi:hypothetical protein